MLRSWLSRAARWTISCSVSALIGAAPAFAQEAPPAPPGLPAEAVAPPAPPPPPPAPPPGPPTAAPPPTPADEAKKDEEVKDGVRLRGGFSINGGAMFLPNLASNIGPAASFGLRLGVQFNHYFGLVYQNTPIVMGTAQPPAQTGTGLATSESASLKAGFADYNSLLAMLTLGNFFDIGAGPSLDFLAVANRTFTGSVANMGVTSTTQSSSGVEFGAHGRVAFNIGGLNGNGPRRSGFAIGVDAHPLFTPAGLGLSLTAGLGGEWY